MSRPAHAFAASWPSPQVAFEKPRRYNPRRGEAMPSEDVQRQRRDRAFATDASRAPPVRQTGNSWHSSSPSTIHVVMTFRPVLEQDIWRFHGWSCSSPAFMPWLLGTCSNPP